MDSSMRNVPAGDCTSRVPLAIGDQDTLTEELNEFVQNQHAEELKNPLRERVQKALNDEAFKSDPSSYLIDWAKRIDRIASRCAVTTAAEQLTFQFLRDKFLRDTKFR